MKLTRDLEVLRKRLGKSLHLDELRKALEAGRSPKEESVPEWVIVYRTAHGYCCMYNGAPVEFPELLDVQVWAEERDVEPYFIGF
jgi:hypothetical protein